MPFMLLKALGGAAKAGGAAVGQYQANKQAEKMATLDRTAPGVVDFSTEMAQPQANLSLQSPTQPKKPFMGY